MTLARNIIVAMALGTLVAAPTAAQESSPTMGRSLATLAQVHLKSRSGPGILLGSRARPGKPTLIAIWASWCLPCVVEAPFLNKLRKDLGDGFAFIYVNRSEGDPDPDQPPAAIARYLANAGMTDVDYVTAGLDAYRQIVGADFNGIPAGKVGVPRVYLFDRNGRQIYTAYGFSGDGTALEARVRQAMAAQ